jgi:hypothetical protein
MYAYWSSFSSMLKFVFGIFIRYTDKNENKISLIYMEIQMGSVAKSNI